MNDAAVPPNKMDGPEDFDDASTEALLTGAGHDFDLHLAALLGDLRVVYTSRTPSVGADLGAFIGLTAGLATASSSSRWAHTRSVIAKICAAVAALVATTSGLAVAGALPAPVQHALSHIGIGGGSSASPYDQHADIPFAADTTTTSVEGATTTVPQNATPTSDADHRGALVSGVAHDQTAHGCEHGHAIANVASDAKSNAQPCPDTSTTIPTGTTSTSTTSRYDPTSDNDHTSPTTTAASPSGRNHDGNSNRSNDSRNGN